MASTYELLAQQSNPLFVPGTSLDVYDAADGTGASQRPPKTALTSVTVASDGSALIEGLDFARHYVAGQVFSGQWYAVGFTTEPAGATAPPGTVSAATNPGDQVAVTTASSTVLDEDLGAVERELVNDHTSNIVYLRLGIGTAVVNAGPRLNPNGGSWRSSTYLGPVQAVSTGSGGVLTRTAV